MFDVSTPAPASGKPGAWPTWIEADMKIVPLNGAKAAGRVALVDDEDCDLVMQYRWHVWERYSKRNPGGQPSHGGPYAHTGIKRGVNSWTNLSMHKLLTGWPRTDHEDHNGLNNQRANLRPATGSQNAANTRPQDGRSSRFKGVCWSQPKSRPGQKPRQAKWVVHIGINGEQRHLGLFVDEVDAARAYDAAARELFGEFACLNLPDLPGRPEPEPRQCALCGGPIPPTVRPDEYYCSPACHDTADAAAAETDRRMRLQARLTRDTELDARIVAMRDGEGATWRAIGRALGIKGDTALAHYLRRVA